MPEIYLLTIYEQTKWSTLDKVNKNNNNHDDIYSAVIYGASHMREFTVVHLGQSRSAPGAANLTFESACRLL